MQIDWWDESWKRQVLQKNFFVILKTKVRDFYGGYWQMIKLVSITMILRTKVVLQNAITKDCHLQRSWKPKSVVEKSWWLYSGTLKVLCSLTSGKRLLQWIKNVRIKPYKKSQKACNEEEGRNWYLPCATQCHASHKFCHNWCCCMFGVYNPTTSSFISLPAIFSCR